MAGPVKSEGGRPALDALRRGRPHPASVYPAARARSARSPRACGARAAASAGAWSPSSACDLVLHEGRSDLLTVTARRDRRRPPAPARATPRALDTAARACDAVGAAVRHRRAASRASSTCSATSSRCSTREPARAGARQPARLPPQAAARRRPRAAAGRVRVVRRARAPQSASRGAAGGVVCTACEAGSFPLGRGGARASWSTPRPAAGRDAAGRRSARCARPSARSPRRSSTTRASGCAPRGRRIGSPLQRWRRKWVYDFAEGSRDMRDLLGGKGANVAEMTRILGAERVPAGFTITTEACVAYMRDERRSPTASTSRSTTALARLEEQRRQAARRRRRPAARLGALAARASRCRGCSTRSSTSASTTSRSQGLAAQHRQRALRLGLLPALRADVRQRRARASRASASRTRSQRVKRERGVKRRHRARRRRAARAHRAASRRSTTSRPTRASSSTQAIRAVFDSWTGERAVAYRRINRIPDDWGTAVNVQQMVFGNKGDTSRLGRRLQPRRGHRRARAVSGDFLLNAQGEDVVSGVRNTARHRRAARLACPRSHAQLMEILRDARAPLRRHAGHRVHGRGGAPVHAADAQRQAPGAGGACASPSTRSPRGCSTKARGARRRSTPRRSTRCCTRPSTRTPTTRCSPRGVAASPGAAKGEIVFTAADAVAGRRRRARRRSSCARSPRPTTSPASTPRRGILTSEGGKASHAALVARGMGVPGGDRRRRRSRSTSRRGEVRVGGTRAARGRPASRSTARPATITDRRRAARRARGRRATSSTVLRVGRRAAHARRARERRHARGRARRRASSAPRASACAAPSTCSSAPTASRRCVAVILADDDEERRARARRAAAAAAGRLRGDLRGDGRACR